MWSLQYLRGEKSTEHNDKLKRKISTTVGVLSIGYGAITSVILVSMTHIAIGIIFFIALMIQLLLYLYVRNRFLKSLPTIIAFVIGIPLLLIGLRRPGFDGIIPLGIAIVLVFLIFSYGVMILIMKLVSYVMVMNKNTKIVSILANGFLLLGVLFTIFLQVREVLSYQDVVFEDFLDSDTYIKSLIIIDVLVVLLFIIFNSLPIILSSVFRKKGLCRLLFIAVLFNITNICFHSFYIFIPEMKLMEILNIIGAGDIYYYLFGGFNKAGAAHLAFIIANMLLLYLNIYYMAKNTQNN